MIITSVIVLAITGSAFAFKVKIGAYCIVANSAGSTNCTTYVLNKFIGSTGPIYKYAPCWDFNKTACTAANNGLCTSSTTIQFDIIAN